MVVEEKASVHMWPRALQLKYSFRMGRFELHSV